MTYTKPELIYFIKPVGMEGPVKIGCSSVPAERLETFAAWSPYPLEIAATAPGGYEIERNLHERFAFAHSHGEWFRAVPELVEAIAAIAAGSPVSEAVDFTVKTGRIRAKITRQAWPEHTRRFMSWMTKTHAAVRRAERSAGVELRMPSRAATILSSMRDGDLGGSRDIAYLEDFVASPFGKCRPALVISQQAAA